MSGKGKTRRWFKEHSADPFVKRAGSAGYRSRAAYKLLQLDEREKLLKPGYTVLDLGAAPGGWSQVAAKLVGPSGRVIAIDLLEMAPIDRVEVIRGDFTDDSVQQALITELPGSMADLVMSDMAPNLSGVKIADQAACEEIAFDVVDFAARVLKPGASLVMKTFHGAAMEAVLKEARQRFERVRMKKPDASRARSAETYLVARQRSGILKS